MRFLFWLLLIIQPAEAADRVFKATTTDGSPAAPWTSRQQSLCVVPSDPIKVWRGADEKDCLKQGGTFTAAARAWGLVIGNSAGNGTLWSGDGYDYGSLDSCKQAWHQHMAQNPTWPREQWKAYCAGSDGSRVDIYP